MGAEEDEDRAGQGEMAGAGEDTQTGQPGPMDLYLDEEEGTTKPDPVDTVDGERVGPYRRIQRARRPTQRQLWREQCPILQLRFEENITQTELARLAKGQLSQMTISALEHNRGKIESDIVKAIAVALNVDPQKLYIDYTRWGAMEPKISQKENVLAVRRTVRKYSPILRRCRRVKMTVRELCDRCGVSPATVYDYASNPRSSSIRLGVLASMARALSCDFQRLCFDLLEWQEWFSDLDEDDIMVEGLLYEEKLAKEGRY